MKDDGHSFRKTIDLEQAKEVLKNYRYQRKYLNYKIADMHPTVKRLAKRRHNPPGTVYKTADNWEIFEDNNPQSFDEIEEEYDAEIEAVMDTNDKKMIELKNLKEQVRAYKHYGKIIYDQIHKLEEQEKKLE